MRLANDWWVVLRHAWSIRLILLAGILSGIEAALPLFSFKPSPWLAAATVIIVMAAFIARLVAQEKVK